jgi:hypothetical protein
MSIAMAIDEFSHSPARIRQPLQGREAAFIAIQMSLMLRLSFPAG